MSWIVSCCCLILEKSQRKYFPHTRRRSSLLVSCGNISHRWQRTVLPIRDDGSDAGCLRTPRHPARIHIHPADWRWMNAGLILLSLLRQIGKSPMIFSQRTFFTSSGRTANGRWWSADVIFSRHRATMGWRQASHRCRCWYGAQLTRTTSRIRWWWTPSGGPFLSSHSGCCQSKRRTVITAVATQWEPVMIVRPYNDGSRFIRCPPVTVATISK